MESNHREPKPPDLQSGVLPLNEPGMKSTRWGSNPRSRPWQGRAIPLGYACRVVTVPSLVYQFPRLLLRHPTELFERLPQLVLARIAQDEESTRPRPLEVAEDSNTRNLLDTASRAIRGGEVPARDPQLHRCRVPFFRHTQYSSDYLRLSSAKGGT